MSRHREPAPDPEAAGDPAPADATPTNAGLNTEDCTGTGAATIRVADRDRAFPLDELRLIRREVERYLAEEKPRLEPGVFGPGEVFIDCWGTARMGAWILESAHSAEPELHLTFRVSTGELLLIRQIISLELEDGRWRATGTDIQTAHRLQ